MSNDGESCLVAKLSHYIDLDDVALDHITSLEEQERSFAKHRDVYSVEDSMDYLYVVKTGWLYSYTDLPDGRRQIIKISHPGDLLGMPDVSFRRATCNVRTSEDTVVCPFPKRKLDVVFEESPRLTALLYTLANREMATMVDTLRALGRMSARERISYFLLDLVARLRITNPGMGRTLRMPLNQHEIGDHLGLTHTYVSKTIREMEKDGTISRSGETITLEAASAMAEAVEFTDRYAEMDTSWFPQK